MSDGTLSQDEIDALLQGTDELMTENLGTTAPMGYEAGPSVSAESISENDKATLGDLLREIGSAQAAAISTLTSVTTKFSSPFIDAGQLEALKKDIKGKVIQAKVSLTGGLSGEWVYIVPDKSVLAVTNILIGQDDNTEVTDLVINTFGEVITQTTGALMSVLTDRLGKTITPGFPHLDFLQDATAISVAGGAYVVRMNYVFNLQDKGSARFFVFIPITMARSIISSFNAAKNAGAMTAGQEAAAPMTGVQIKPVAFEPLQMGVESEAMGNITLLLDVPMRVTVELGRTKMTIKDILGLGEGSIIELDKLAGEPVDILVNDKAIAQGEVVVIDENFAVRVTKIVTPMERIFESPESQF
ncbi:MAG: flagellar motor switch protein FliN [Brevinematales bacterium]|nr:flagellar motor switch protein FliN [Brevinematales bacterium]